MSSLAERIGTYLREQEAERREYRLVRPEVVDYRHLMILLIEGREYGWSGDPKRGALMRCAEHLLFLRWQFRREFVERGGRTS